MVGALPPDRVRIARTRGGGHLGPGVLGQADGEAADPGNHPELGLAVRRVATQLGCTPQYAFAGTVKRTRGTAPGTWRRDAALQSQELKSTAPIVAGRQ